MSSDVFKPTGFNPQSLISLNCHPIAPCGPIYHQPRAQKDVLVLLEPTVLKHSDPWVLDSLDTSTVFRKGLMKETTLPSIFIMCWLDATEISDTCLCTVHASVIQPLCFINFSPSSSLFKSKGTRRIRVNKSVRARLWWTAPAVFPCTRCLFH